MPPTQNTVSALLERMQRPAGYATGGSTKPAPPPPQKPRTVTADPQNMLTYGERPEWQFFSPQTLNFSTPPATGNGASGQGGGSNNPFPTDPQHPYGGDGSGSRNPWNNGQGTPTPAGNGGQPGSGTPISIRQLLTGNPPPPTPPVMPSQPPVNQALANAQRLGLVPQQATPQPIVAASPAPQPPQQPVSANPLTQYLQSLGNFQGGQQPGAGSPRNMATGGPVTGDQIQPGHYADDGQWIDGPGSYINGIWTPQAAATPTGNMIGDIGLHNQGGVGQNKTGQDLANSDVAVNPSLKSAIGIGSMVAGLAMSPAMGAITTAGKLALGALTGQPMSDPFDVPGPRLTADQLQAAADAYNNTTGALTSRLAAYNKSIENSRTIDRGGQLGGPGPGLSAGIGVDSAGHAYASNIGGGGVSHNLAGRGGAGAPSGGGDRAGDGYGGQGGDIGSGRGDMSGGEGPDKGGLYARGGRIRHLAKGGLPRFPSVRHFAEGGSMSPSNQFLDASSASMANVPPPPQSGGFNTAYLPLLAGFYGSQSSGPLAGAASLGAATALSGGTMDDALSGARLLYQSGAANQPHAQQQRWSPDISTRDLQPRDTFADLQAPAAGSDRNTTSALLQALGQQQGITGALQNAAAGRAAQGVTPLTYAAPGPRAMAGGGGTHAGPGSVRGEGGGQDDRVPAMLSPGEFVVSAQDVSDLGDGDNDEGARRLEKMREMIRRNAGRKNVKTIAKKQPPVTKILQHFAGGRA